MSIPNLLMLPIHAAGIVDGGTGVLQIGANVVQTTRDAAGRYFVFWGTEIAEFGGIFTANVLGATAGSVRRALSSENFPGQPADNQGIVVQVVDMAGAAADLTFEFVFTRFTLP